MAVDPAHDPLALVRRYLETGDARRALAELEKAPGGVDDEEFWSLRAHALYGLGRWDEAAQAAQAGLELEADDFDLLDLLALAELERGREKKARATIDSALRALPGLGGAPRAPRADPRPEKAKILPPRLVSRGPRRDR